MLNWNVKKSTFSSAPNSFAALHKVIASLTRLARVKREALYQPNHEEIIHNIMQTAFSQLCPAGLRITGDMFTNLFEQVWLKLLVLFVFNGSYKLIAPLSMKSSFSLPLDGLLAQIRDKWTMQQIILYF